VAGALNFMWESTLASIRAGRLVPIVAIDDAAAALDLADAVLDAGLRVIEITFRTRAAAESLATIASKRPQMLVGAGTLLSAADVSQALDAGAKFGVAPGLNERTVAAAQQAGLDFAPGVATPTEVERAMDLGCTLLKFFPAERAGGVKWLKAMEGPYGHTGVQFLPAGGLDAANMKPYLALKCVTAIGGSWFVDKDIIARRDWKTINQLTRQALAAARECGD
jgi:2-dehydro-3-deoxyphosphogluconate aldolase/(4S)-4-hydroxy-2-oxoglutarate aldolase